MTHTKIVASGLKGVLVATEITLIVFGALLIFEMLKHTGLFKEFQRIAVSFSQDIRVQTIFIAFTLVYFIEGAAGFGTPALIAVLLLILLGIPPILSVMLALVGDMTPVIFGAIGLPVTYGIGASLSSPESVPIENITEAIATLNIFGNLLLVTILTVLVVYSYS